MTDLFPGDTMVRAALLVIARKSANGVSPSLSSTHTYSELVPVPAPAPSTTGSAAKDDDKVTSAGARVIPIPSRP